MILVEQAGGEDHPAYRKLEAANLRRQYDFLQSLVEAALETDQPYLSHAIVRTLHVHAMSCLFEDAGVYRKVAVRAGGHRAALPSRVPDLMELFINQVNRAWAGTDALTLCAFVYWRICHIHPFVNGNGRAARAASYFVLCVKNGAWLPGDPILPERMRLRKPLYGPALSKTDEGAGIRQTPLGALKSLISADLSEQLRAAGAPSPGLCADLAKLAHLPSSAVH
ncbi:MAG: Fic family protein [Geminicoccaceae bacterium]